MSRYLMLYKHFLIFSIKRAMEFRVDFFFRIAMDIVFYIINILFFKVLFLHTKNFGGLTEDQAMIFVGSYLFLDAFYMTFLSNNMWWLPTFINKGDLDYYLIRPASPIFFLSLRDIAANSFINLLMTIAILIIGFKNYETPIPLLNIFLFLFFIFLGTYLYYLIRVLSILPVFWVQAGRGLDEITYTFNKAMEKPHTIYSGFMKRILVSVLPYSLIISYPVWMLFNGFNLEMGATIVSVALIFTIVTNYVWKKALRIYHSASS